MRIVLVGNYEDVGSQSMRRFAMVLERLLRQAGHDVRTVRPPRVFGRLLPISNLPGRWLGYIDQFILFPPILRRLVKDADVVHICDHSNAMQLLHVRHRPYLITCHDLLGIHGARGLVRLHTTGLPGRILQEWIARTLRLAPAVVCVSEQTLRDFRSTFDTSSRALRIIHNCLQYPYSPMPIGEAKARLAELGLDRAPFFVSVGGNQWYKNRIGLLRLFNSLIQFPEFERHHLAVVGRAFSTELSRFVSVERLQNRVHELGTLSNEHLRALYSTAEALLFPSLAEGFGWPIIEAQACGCPVVTSDRPPMNEVGGKGGAIYVDPEDAPAAAAAVRLGLRKRKDLISAGLLNLKRFSEEAFLRGYTEAYQEAMALFKQEVG